MIFEKDIKYRLDFEEDLKDNQDFEICFEFFFFFLHHDVGQYQ